MGGGVHQKNPQIKARYFYCSLFFFFILVEFVFAPPPPKNSSCPVLLVISTFARDNRCLYMSFLHKVPPVSNDFTHRGLRPRTAGHKQAMDNPWFASIIFYSLIVASWHCSNATGHKKSLPTPFVLCTQTIWRLSKKRETSKVLWFACIRACHSISCVRCKLTIDTLLR